MHLTAIAIVAAAAAPSCMQENTGKTREWLVTAYRVLPAAEAQQAELQQHLAVGVLAPADASLTALATSDSAARAAEFHYLTKVAYIGVPENQYSLPSGVVLGVDVDTDSIAHIGTFVLASAEERRTTEIAVVLAGDIPLKGVLSYCGGAQ